MFPRTASHDPAPPNAEYRDVMAQIAARQAARRAAVSLAARSVPDARPRRRPLPDASLIPAGLAEAG